MFHSFVSVKYWFCHVHLDESFTNIQLGFYYNYYNQIYTLMFVPNCYAFFFHILLTLTD